MFDIQTEAWLRGAHPRDGDGDGDRTSLRIVPLAVAIGLLIWTTVLVAAL